MSSTPLTQEVTVDSEASLSSMILSLQRVAGKLEIDTSSISSSEELLLRIEPLLPSHLKKTAFPKVYGLLRGYRIETMAEGAKQSDSSALTLQDGFSEQYRSKNGIDYTPASLASTLVEDCWGSDADRKRTFFDPACGNGQLLLAASRKALLEIKDEQEALSFLENHVIGIERDPVAAILSYLRIIVEFELTFPRIVSQLKRDRVSIWCGDFLFCEETRRALRNQLERVSSEATLISVANPPFGLTRQEVLSKQQAQALKTRYKSFRFSKLNAYLAFLAEVLMIEVPSHKLGFIIPDTFLSIDNATGLREEILKLGAIRSIRRLSQDVFGGRKVETIVLSLELRERHDTFLFHSLRSQAEDPVYRTSKVQVQSCLSAPGKIISGRFNENFSSVTEEILSCSVPLGSNSCQFSASIALQAYSRGKGSPPQTSEIVRTKPFHFDKQELPSDLPYLRGRDVESYGTKPPKSYLRWGPWLAEPGKLELFTRPRLLIREVLGKYPELFRVALCEAPVLYNKSVLHIHHGSDHIQSLTFLEHLLLSRLSSYWLFHRGKKSRRSLFPKVLESDLSDLPVPTALTDEALQKAVQLRSEALFLESKDEFALREFRVRRDQFIFESFQLSDESIERILSFSPSS